MLRLLTYMTLVNGLITGAEYYNDIDELLDVYCNKHGCSNCSIALKGAICFHIFVRNKYRSYMKK